MISGRCFFIVILVVVFNVDALIGSNHPRQPPPKEKTLISTGLYYKRESLNLPEDTTEVYTCLEDAYHFLINSISMINSTSNRYYDRLYYLNQKTDRDKLRRSFNNYTCPMTMNLGNVNGHVVYIYDYLTLDKTNWKCLIPEGYVCDGFSHCLTDECRCERTENINPVFYCAQQPGCVTFLQVTNTVCF